MFTLYGLCSYVASWMIESKGVWNLAKVRVSRLLGRARSVHRVKARKLKRFLLTLRDHFQIGNLLPILRVIKNLHGGSIVVETSSTCLKDGCHCLCYTTWNIVKSLKVMGLFSCEKNKGDVKVSGKGHGTCGEVDVKISCSRFALVDFCSSLHKPVGQVLSGNWWCSNLELISSTYCCLPQNLSKLT